MSVQAESRSFEGSSAEALRQRMETLQARHAELEAQNFELLRKQEEMRRECSRYAGLYNNATVGICSLDEKLVITQANLTLAALLQTDLPRIQALGLASFILKDDWEMLRGLCSQAFESRLQVPSQTGLPESAFECNLQMVRSDGCVFWVHLRGIRLVDPNSATKELTLTVKDIEEEKRAQLKSREEASNYHAILSAIPDLLFELDLEGTYLDYHSSRRDLLLVPPESFLGKRVREILPPVMAEITMSALYEADQKGSSHGKQIYLDVPGNEGWFELSVAKKASTGTGIPRFIVLSRDITDRKNAETSLRNQAELLESTGQLANVSGWSVNLVTMKLSWTKQTFRIAEIDPPH